MIPAKTTTKGIPIFGIFKAYAAILFCQHNIIGISFVLATFLFPNTGISGLLAAITGYFSAKLLKFPNTENGMYIYNSLLVGLTLGATYHFDHYLAVLIIFGAVMAVFVTAITTDLLWRWEHLPVLSLPFVIVALIVSLAAKGYGSLTHVITPYTSSNFLIHPIIDNFFISLGATFFVPIPLAGVIFFCGILITSRYLVLLAVSGYCVGAILFSFFTGGSNENLVAWSGFNYILTAIAIGGIFTVPGWRSFIIAMIGAGIAALITAATQNFLRDYGIPVFAIPFIFATFSVLAALRKRVSLTAPYLLLEDPNTPEANYEKARISKARSGEINSLPLAVPFFGKWYVSQGFNGEHTHKAPWQYALDFIVIENGKSHQYDGKNLEDYYCFNLPINSPAYGIVVRVVNNIKDNTPGEVDTENNWGNFVLIKTTSGIYVLLCHLKNDSVKVKEGDYVKPGDIVGACGNSGRSTQPHLHIHTQKNATLGSPTTPFHLVSLLVENDKEKCSNFKLNHKPEQGEIIMAAEKTAKLAKQLHLPVGRTLRYKSKINDNEAPMLEIVVELTLTGQFRVASNSGASCAFQENEGLLAFYDRTGPEDLLFDIWLLNFGITPLSEGANNWLDKPSSSLLPLNFKQKTILYFTSIFNPEIISAYKRSWNDIGGYWKQESTHILNTKPFLNVCLETCSIICTENGFKKVFGKFENNTYHLDLHSTEQKGDAGIERWVELSEEINTKENLK